ncbi:PKD domain-containing protein [Homoserinibacter sp. YIM 151385]|uniref:PKD domain-containing protein n=1 Tax=Homoserinibacter sp. YIM 151385 TaxID=2985506 RepID=UPI0022F06D37|nr:hypothetical protein [Homoserinibacter sp. YIM 151385]WBU39120.1 hypothetical protein OF852_05970 [Homoserinibacter sp. YIM 151385]
MTVAALLLLAASAPNDDGLSASTNEGGDSVVISDSERADWNPAESGPPPSPPPRDINDPNCYDDPDPMRVCRDDYHVTAPVTARDIAAFTPDRPAAASEPRTWAIVRTPANFVGDASRHVETGELLDQPAEVRFEPAAYYWSYGDGTERTTRAGGATWDALDRPDFSETPTSHEYARSGTYTVRLVVEYSAEYRVAGAGWVPVIGTVRSAAPPLQLRVASVDTVLVDRDCRENPRGPGC